MSLKSFLLTLKGGSGSGNFGHSGRIGKRGGSSPVGAKTLNLYGIEVKDRLNTEASRRAADLTAREISYLKENYPLFQRETISRKALITGEEIADFSQLQIDSRGSGGWSSGRMSIGFPPDFRKDQIKGDPSKLNLEGDTRASNWKEGMDMSKVEVYVPSLVRHEMGHYAMDKLLTDKEIGDWKQIHNKTKPQLEKVLDSYYTDKHTESFAESLAIVTHRGYKKGMLPSEIEDYFDNLK